MVLIRAGHDSATRLDYRSAQRREDRSGLYQDQAVQDRVIGKRLARRRTAGHFLSDLRRTQEMG